VTTATPPKAAEPKDDAAKAAEGSQEKPAEADKPAEGGAPAEEQKTEPVQPVQQYETKQRTRKNFSKIKFST